MAERSGFNWRVVDQIQKLIVDAKTTDAQVIRDSSIPRNTFYKKMRGETALTTDDIAKLARALGVEPGVVFERAAAEVPYIGRVPREQIERRAAETEDEDV